MGVFVTLAVHRMGIFRGDPLIPYLVVGSRLSWIDLSGAPVPASATEASNSQ